jgi:hypothetical protein
MKITYTSMAKLIGKTAKLNIERLLVSVHVMDVKTAFGRIDVLVEPVTGSGEKWVSSEKIVTEDET